MLVGWEVAPLMIKSAIPAKERARAVRLLLIQLNI